MTGAQGFSATDAELGFLNANDFIPRLAFGEDDLRRCRRRRRVIACMRQLRDTRAIIYMVACKSDGYPYGNGRLAEIVIPKIAF
jgi:hypothetical protein